MSHESNVAAKEVLAGLRAALDSDAERAGRKYALLRRKLVSFFEWSGAAGPDVCADEVLTTIAWKMTDGTAISNLPAACLATARDVLAKQTQAHAAPAAADATPATAEPDPFGDLEWRLHAFETNLDALTQDSRDLLLTYFAGDTPHAVEARQALARQMKLPAYQLRFHAHRTRSQLEQSVLGLHPPRENR